MPDRTSSSIAQHAKTRKRKFYNMSFNFYRAGALGYHLQDENVIQWGMERLSDLTEKPCFVFDRAQGRLPEDLEEYGLFWLVSDRAKVVFESVDPEGFAFIPCSVQVPRGAWEGQRYWLCEVRRFLDALDEVHSRFVKVLGDDPGRGDFGRKFYDFSMQTRLVFREEQVGDAHAFRMAYHKTWVICDQTMKDACKQAGLKGISFRDLSRKI